MVKTLVEKTLENLANNNQFAKVFLPIFTAFNRSAYGFRLLMAKHMGLLFMVVYSFLAYRHQACSTVVTTGCISVMN